MTVLGPDAAQIVESFMLTFHNGVTDTLNANVISYGNSSTAVNIKPPGNAFLIDS